MSIIGAIQVKNFKELKRFVAVQLPNIEATDILRYVEEAAKSDSVNMIEFLLTRGFFTKENASLLEPVLVKIFGACSTRAWLRIYNFYLKLVSKPKKELLWFLLQRSVAMKNAVLFTLKFIEQYVQWYNPKRLRKREHVAGYILFHIKLEIVEMIYPPGLSFNKMNEGLARALQTGRLDIIVYFLDHGADAQSIALVEEEKDLRYSKSVFSAKQVILSTHVWKFLFKRGLNLNTTPRLFGYCISRMLVTSNTPLKCLLQHFTNTFDLASNEFIEIGVRTSRTFCASSVVLSRMFILLYVYGCFPSQHFDKLVLAVLKTKQYHILDQLDGEEISRIFSAKRLPIGLGDVLTPDVLNELLKRYKFNVNGLIWSGERSLMTQLCMRNKKDLILILLANGANPNITGSIPSATLSLACQYTPTLIDILLAHGAIFTTEVLDLNILGLSPYTNVEHQYAIISAIAMVCNDVGYLRNIFIHRFVDENHKNYLLKLLDAMPFSLQFYCNRALEHQRLRESIQHLKIQ